MWLVTQAALDSFTVHMIKSKSCRRISDSLEVQVKLLKQKGVLNDSAVKIRSVEALMWHNKLDSCDLDLQNTRIKLVRETESKNKWKKATIGSGAAAVIFLITSIILGNR